MKTLWKDIYQYVLGAVIILLFGAILFIAMLYEQADNAVLNTLVGAFASCVVMVVTYFFGSSKGSSEKNDLLRNNK